MDSLKLWMIVVLNDYIIIILKNFYIIKIFLIMIFITKINMEIITFLKKIKDKCFIRVCKSSYFPKNNDKNI